jgi:hypothetical protein
MTADRLTRTQRRILNVLEANDGTVTYLPGSTSVRVMGLPGRQKVRGPTHTLTALMLEGLIRLGDGGQISLTERGRDAAGTGRRPGRTVHTGRRSDGPAGDLAGAAATVGEAVATLDELKAGEPWLPLTIPQSLRARLAQATAELKDIRQHLAAAAQRAGASTRKAA